MIETPTEHCPNCDEDRALIYRRSRNPPHRGHWLCAVCFYPIRDAQKLTRQSEPD